MFERLKNAMKEWSEVFQPAYDDIGAWKDIEDIGKFSEKTLKEMREAWATIPKATQKNLYKAYKLLLKCLDSETLKKIIELYMKSIKKND